MANNSVARRTAVQSTVLALLSVLALTLAACTASGDASTVHAANLNLDWTWQGQQAPLTLGVTHTQHDLNPQDPSSALARAKNILAASTGYQDQALMGWGTFNPEPSPGNYNWASLDRRMSLIKATGGKATLTLCCAPDWMKGGKPGTTDWSQLEVAPTPDHYDDFAALAAAAVKRYPQVKHVMVWNEFKGFYDKKKNRWNAAAYTKLYNDVYDAVKKARPEVQVGGPYVPIDAWSKTMSVHYPSSLHGPWGTIDQRSLDAIKYWLAHKHGADFIVVDGGTVTKDSGLITDPALAVGKFATTNRWLHAHTSLPVWWAEFYPDARTDGGPTQPQSAAATLEALAAFARSGTAAAFLWQPQGEQSFPYAALWTSTAGTDGGRPTPLTGPWKWLLPRLRAGNVSVGTATMPTEDSSGVHLLAFRSDETLLVNTSPHPIVLRKDHGTVTVGPWGTILVSNASVT
jgi:hypothetical protein